MQDRIFYSVCFGFILGVLVRSFIFINFYFDILFGIISFALFLFFLVRRSFSEGGYFHSWGIIVSIFFVAFSFGILRFHMIDKPNPPIFEAHLGQKVTLIGEIVDEPSIGETNQKLTVNVSDSRGKTSGVVDILVSTGLDDNYAYGDKINFSGTLKKPENFTTDQGKVFDYVNYLKKDGVLYVMSYPKVSILSHNNGNFIKSKLFLVKEKFVDKINSAISSPENIFMGGLILGEKSSFSQGLHTEFVNTGTIHIVALSGYNVTIVAEWIMKIFSMISFIPKIFGIYVGILSIILFILMTGGSSTAVRAGIMSVLALVARATGRNYDVARALILAFVVMIILNPMLLVFDVSFQLSFLATIAVIFLAPRIEKYFTWVTEKFGLRDIVSVTCAAYIFVFPFILYQMGNFSLVALPANVLILPFIPFTMLIGFVTGFLGFVSYIFAVPAGFVSYLFLHYELGVIHFFASLPFAAFSFPDFPLVLTILIYAYFVFRLFGRNIKSYLTEPF